MKREKKRVLGRSPASCRCRCPCAMEALADGRALAPREEEPPAWLPRVEQCVRGVFLRLVNDTSEKLFVENLVSTRGDLCATLPDFVAPFGAVLDVGFASHGWSAGVDGEVRRALGWWAGRASALALQLFLQGGTIRLVWSNPYLTRGTFEAMMNKAGLEK